MMPSWRPVYTLVKKIPRGRVTTYGALAKAIRLKGGARAAGHAMAACYSGEGIPWHRVLAPAEGCSYRSRARAFSDACLRPKESF